MSWIVNNFKCKTCEAVFEELYKKDEEHLVTCSECESDDCVKTLCAPALGVFSMANAEDKATMLKKRSADHTKKEILKNADRFGDAGIERRNKYLRK